MRQAQRSQGPGLAVGGPTRSRARALGIAYLLACAGCAVDDRTLAAGEAAAGSSASGGSTADPIHAGVGGEMEMEPLPRCLYLGTELEADCETLVKNPGFSKNIANWNAEPVGISEEWSRSDASDDANSGAIAVLNLNYSIDENAKNGTNGGGSRQCIPISSGKTYDLGADIFIPAGQGMGFEGVYISVAALSLFFYSEPDCGGRTQSNFTSTPIDQTDEWVHVEGSALAPKESQSMAVRLATLKPFRQNMFVAHFDNIFVRERSAP
jgi:hypothetical protein